MSIDHRLKKVVLCITEDWFALSHFLPLLDVLTQASNEVVVVTRCAGQHRYIEKLGARVIHFDYQRASLHPLSNFRRASILAKILKTENPDVLHCISMKPIVLGAIASSMHKIPNQVFHVTGLGLIATSDKLATKLARRISFQILKQNLKTSKSWLLTENKDDLDYLRTNGVAPKNPGIIIAGSGINPHKHVKKTQGNTAELISVAMACRMIKSKGIADVVKAHQLLAQENIDFSLDLYGEIDVHNPDSHAKSDIENWTRHENINWHGFVENAWETADIAVLASHDREGLPRSMLEAASRSIPLVVTDVPGCRDFVRNGIEGLIVPSKRPQDLANALRKLVNDATLRRTMGQRARARVLERYTEDHVKQSLCEIYNQIQSQ